MTNSLLLNMAMEKVNLPSYNISLSNGSSYMLHWDQSWMRFDVRSILSKTTILLEIWNQRPITWVGSVQMQRVFCLACTWWSVVQQSDSRSTPLHFMVLFMSIVIVITSSSSCLFTNRICKQKSIGILQITHSYHTRHAYENTLAITANNF